MDDKRRPLLAELPHFLRERLVDLSVWYRDWREASREDRGAIWRSPILRIGVLVILAILAVYAAGRMGVGLLPRGPSYALDQPTQTATLYVACADAECRANYTIQQQMDFAEWPMKCEQCGHDTIYRATRCLTCRRWIAHAPGTDDECPFCADLRRAAEPRPEASDEPTAISDDDEDPW